MFPPLFLSASSSSFFHCALQEVLALPDERKTCPYYFSLRLFTMVRWSDCLLDLDIYRLLHSMVTWSLHEMRRYFAVASHFHGSYSSRKTDVTRERISLSISRVLELREMFLLFQTGFMLVNAVVVCVLQAWNPRQIKLSSGT